MCPNCIFYRKKQKALGDFQIIFQIFFASFVPDLRARLNEEDCFQFDFIYFVQFNLHLIGRKVNLQAVIFKRVKFDKKSFWTFSFDFFVQFGEFVQPDVACPMKPKQTTQTYALSSTLQRRDPSISRGKATGAAAARAPTAPSTE